MPDPKVKYILELADNAMILGQRISEWCGHGPVLEKDIALTNIALDLIGEARYFYAYCAEIEGNGKTEDTYPFTRTEREFYNVLLVERPNRDWGHTLMRQFMFDCYHYFVLDGLRDSADSRIAEIANKTIKESNYHLNFSSQWVIRLGDGTEESHHRMQDALNRLIYYFEEMFVPTDSEKQMFELGVAPDINMVKIAAHAKFQDVINEATLVIPQNIIPQFGGKNGLHTEDLGHILCSMQYMQRTYPNQVW